MRGTRGVRGGYEGGTSVVGGYVGVGGCVGVVEWYVGIGESKQGIPNHWVILFFSIFFFFFFL